MQREIRALLVDESRENLAVLSKQLGLLDVTVVGEAGFGAVAYNWAVQLEPDIILVAAEEPVARALKTIEALTIGDPSWPVIAISSKTDTESIRKAMRVGADDYVSRSNAREELKTAIASLMRREHHRVVSGASGAAAAGHRATIISVFGVKGGIGKTTISTNLATSIALESKQRVALLDMDMQFGDVALVMEVSPDRTIMDVVDSLDKLDADLIDGFLSKHKTGVSVLPAPVHIEGSERITGDHITKILDVLAKTYDYVVLDMPNALNESVLAALEMSTLVLLVTTPEISCIKRTKSCLDLMKYWQYSEDKVKLVINKATMKAAVSAEDIEAVFAYNAFWKLPFDKTADMVVGAGGLFVHTHPQTQISKSIYSLARRLLGSERVEKVSLFDRLKAAFSFLKPKASPAAPQQYAAADFPMHLSQSGGSLAGEANGFRQTRNVVNPRIDLDPDEEPLLPQVPRCAAFDARTQPPSRQFDLAPGTLPAASLSASQTDGHGRPRAHREPTALPGYVRDGLHPRRRLNGRLRRANGAEFASHSNGDYELPPLPRSSDDEDDAELGGLAEPHFGAFKEIGDLDD